MNPTGDSGKPSQRREEPTPTGLSKGIRAEIAAFFGGAPARAVSDRDRGGYGRLIDDLEHRIVESLREPGKPPPRLGPFVLEKQIGRGAFAVVYRATQERTGARAAVKVVPSSDPESHERVLSEVGSLGRLRHPNIVRVIDTGEEQGFAWIATEYIEGMSLADFIRETRAREQDFYIADTPRNPERPQRRKSTDPEAVRVAITWFRDLARALQALHAIGLVHRDVKPANILLDEDRRPFLIDFGLSSSAESTVSGLLAGTVPYMSPEQTLGGYLGLTPRSDIYSLAATMHEVLTGDRVTRGVRREAILHQIAFVPVPPPSKMAGDVPSSLDPIFAKALAKDSDARYSSAKDLAEDLDHWLAGRTLVHVDEPLGRRVARVLRRHAVATTLASVAVLAALTWGVLAWRSREGEYRDVLRSVQEARDRGDYLAALGTLAQNAPRFGTREAFHQHYREAVLKGGEALAEKLLGSQAFSAAGLASQSDHGGLAREAEAHLEQSQTEEPYLILVSALSKHLAGRPAEARAVLDAHPVVVSGSRSLTELSAIVAIWEKDEARYEAAMTRLAGLPRRDVKPTELCLATWREIFCLRSEGFPKPGEDSLKQLEADLAFILRAQPDHALAQSLLGMLKLERKDYQGALMAFAGLLKLPSSDADRAGTLLMHSAASMLAAGTASQEERTRLFATADDYAQKAIALHPPLMDWLLDFLRSASWGVQAHWVRSALTFPPPARAALGRRFLTFAAHTIVGAPDTEGEAVVLLSEAISRQYAMKLDPEMSRDYVGIQRRYLVSLMRLAADAIEGNDVARANDYWTRGRTCVRETRDRVPSLPYQMLADDALLAAYPVDWERDPARKQRLRAEAIPLLRIATDGDLLDGAFKDSPSPEGKAEIRFLYGECNDRLQRFESEIEQDATSRGV